MAKRFWGLLFALTAGAAFAQKVAEITFVAGRVEVFRNEQTLAEGDLEIGSPIENLDRIRTGDDGEMIIAITAEAGAPAEIRIAPRTVFCVEIEQLERGSATTLGLMAGSIALKVRRLGGNRSLAVRTETTTMGVRGTTFEVTTAPSGDVLVSTEEGSVVCTDEERGEELLAEPGQAVERRAEEDSFRAIAVRVTDLERFRRDWLAERIQVFRSNALRVTRFYAARYEALLEEFERGYDALMTQAAVIAKWAREDREGRVGSPMEVMREKRAVVGALFRLRRTLFVFERVYYRLAELEQYYREGYGQGQLRPGLTAGEFWRAFEDGRRELAAKMARVRYVVKLYAKRNDGAFPVEF